MKIIDTPSGNFGERRDGKKPTLLILHYTGSKTAQQALDLLRGSDPAHQVSAHYMIDTDGAIHRLVAEDKRAWHAGKSFWAGEEDINSASIGIEIHNPGHEYGYTAFPAPQMKAARDLCLDILSRQTILPQHVLAHSDIAPERKDDPGELFPWEWLAQSGIGLWPTPSPEDDAEAKKIWKKPETILTLFAQYGYNTAGDIKKLVTAFQRHFEPEIFKLPDNVGTPNLVTVSRLLALVRQKSAPLA